MRKIAVLVLTLTICFGLTKNVLADPYYNPTLSDTVLNVISNIATQNSRYNNLAMDDYYLNQRVRMDREMYLRAERERRISECLRNAKHNHKYQPYGHAKRLCYADYRH